MWAVAISPLRVRLAKLILRHLRRPGKVRSATLLVGSTPSTSKKCDWPFGVNAQCRSHVAYFATSIVQVRLRQSEHFLPAREHPQAGVPGKSFHSPPLLLTELPKTMKYLHLALRLA